MTSPKIRLSLAILLAVPFVQGPAAAQSDPALPYWASISVDEARMRKGPSPDVPVIWEYRRKDLPVKVVARHENWRKVEDPDGTQGWMAARLLSRTRTAIVTGEIRPMRTSADASAAIAFRAEPGVVGRITNCKDGWCLFDVKGRRGWIETGHIWGD
jgi:SH3-like domain-containing protein